MAIAGVAAGVVVDRLFLDVGKEVPPLEVVADDTASVSFFAQDSDVTASAQGGTFAVQTTPVETFDFDPNTADSTTLLRLGLPAWQVRSIYRFRAKGGRFHRPEDFQRVYGMTPDVYERLAQHIKIDRRFQPYSETGYSGSSGVIRDTSVSRASRTSGDTVGVAAYPYQEKFTTPVVLDLNTVDTATLKMVPGIGSYRARRIVEYRTRLGGFVDVEQLSEIQGMPDDVKAWFAVESPIFAPVAINSADLQHLAQHPYITYAQARAIIDYRKNYGRIKSIDELSLVGAFTDADIVRLRSYITY